MWSTCEHVFHMSVMIQIRNVPETLHIRLKSLAAEAGMSLSDYLLREVRQIAERPSPDEMRARLAARKPVKLSGSPLKILRSARDGR